MKLKKILSFVMAGVCAVSMSVAPASAAKIPWNQRNTVIKALCRLPKIRVTVPTSGRVYLNPLKLPVKIGTGEENNGQIISTPECIANESEVPVIVDVTVTGTVKSGSTMQLSSTSTEGAGLSSKTAFVYFEMQSADSVDDLDRVYWDSGYDADKHVLVKGTNSKKNIIQLEAADKNGEPTAGGIGAFRLAGDAVEEPKTAWNSKDGLNVTIAFTFTPVSLLE